METWAWLGAYLVGFVLLQVYLYRYFIKRRSASESGGTATGVSKRSALETDHEQDTPAGIRHGDVDHTPDLGPPGDLDTGNATRCEECGAYNERDQMFVYCRNCGEKL